MHKNTCKNVKKYMKKCYVRVGNRTLAQLYNNMKGGGSAKGAPIPLFHVMITFSREAIFLKHIYIAKINILYMELLESPGGDLGPNLSQLGANLGPT